MSKLTEGPFLKAQSPECSGFYLQGISSQTVRSNLAQREGKTNISNILWHLFSRKFKPILISKLTFPKKLKGNYEKLQKNGILFFAQIPFFEKKSFLKISLFSIYSIHEMYITSHFFFGKVSLDIKVDFSCLENKCQGMSKISVLPSLRAKLLYNV